MSQGHQTEPFNFYGMRLTQEFLDSAIDVNKLEKDKQHLDKITAENADFIDKYTLISVVTGAGALASGVLGTMMAFNPLKGDSGLSGFAIFELGAALACTVTSIIYGDKALADLKHSGRIESERKNNDFMLYLKKGKDYRPEFQENFESAINSGLRIGPKPDVV